MHLNRRSLIPALLTAACLLGTSSPVAAAANPVALVIGGSGATPWAIAGIKPGDSGTQTISILNDGTSAGTLTIWVSNIVNTEGTPAQLQPHPGSAGDLGNYITFAAVSPSLSTNISMPALIAGLPQSAVDTHYIKVLSLAAGETVNLNWNWSLPASTGNSVQGDSLSFDINYMLEEIVPPTTTTTTPPTTTTTPPATSTIPPTSSSILPVTITTPPIATTSTPATTPPPATTPSPTTSTPSTTAPVVNGIGTVDVASIVNATGLFADAATLQAVDGNAALDIAAGTTGTNAIGQPLSTITVTPHVPTASPAGIVIGAVSVGSVESLNASDVEIEQSGETYDFGPSGATFNPGVTITLHYNPASLPARLPETGLLLAYFDTTTSEWVVLAGSVVDPVAHTISARVSHFTEFTVVAPLATTATATTTLTPTQKPPSTPASTTASLPVPSSPPLEASETWLLIGVITAAILIIALLLRWIMRQRKPN